MEVLHLPHPELGGLLRGGEHFSVDHRTVSMHRRKALGNTGAARRACARRQRESAPGWRGTRRSVQAREGGRREGGGRVAWHATFVMSANVGEAFVNRNLAWFAAKSSTNFGICGMASSRALKSQ